MARKRQQREQSQKKAGGKISIAKPEDPVDIQYLLWLADARDEAKPFALPHDKALRFMKNGWVQEAAGDKAGSLLYSITDGGLQALKEVIDVRNEPSQKV